MHKYKLQKCQNTNYDWFSHKYDLICPLQDWILKFHCKSSALTALTCFLFLFQVTNIEKVNKKYIYIFCYSLHQAPTLNLRLCCNLNLVLNLNIATQSSYRCLPSLKPQNLSQIDGHMYVALYMWLYISGFRYVALHRWLQFVGFRQMASDWWLYIGGLRQAALDRRPYMAALDRRSGVNSNHWFDIHPLHWLDIQPHW